jgi:hypothetical protein
VRDGRGQAQLNALITPSEGIENGDNRCTRIEHANLLAKASRTVEEEPLLKTLDARIESGNAPN